MIISDSRSTTHLFRHWCDITDDGITRPVGQHANHIPIWLLFIFRWVCSEPKTILQSSSRQPSALLRERFTPASYMSNLSYPCDMAHLRMANIPDGATLGRTLTTWYLCEGSPYLTTSTTHQTRCIKGINITCNQIIVIWYSPFCWRSPDRRRKIIFAKSCRGITFLQHLLAKNSFFAYGVASRSIDAWLSPPCPRNYNYCYHIANKINALHGFLVDAQVNTINNDNHIGSCRLPYSRHAGHDKINNYKHIASHTITLHCIGYTTSHAHPTKTS